MNASGKSSLMKAVGIAVLLAQVGCYVPATSLTLKPYKSLYTRILNQDNIHAGLSSFAVEMLELREILKTANSYSLVLGDELCSGTESVSATALVASGIIWLSEKNVSFIFATHLHGLNDIKELQAVKSLQVWHLKVHYDAAADLLIYDRRLEPGSGSTYYGLEVAKAMNIPFEFLELAHSIRKDLLHQTTKVSSYNKDCIVRICEICKSSISHMLEVHHIAHQKDGGSNDLRNLIVVCQACHDAHHAGSLEISQATQTSQGPKRLVKEKDPKQTNEKSERNNIVLTYMKKYPNITLKRLAYELETHEDIKLSESALRTIRKSI
jgi:DNA mismatch repair protein MutS